MSTICIRRAKQFESWWHVIRAVLHCDRNKEGITQQPWCCEERADCTEVHIRWCCSARCDNWGWSRTDTSMKTLKHQQEGENVSAFLHNYWQTAVMRGREKLKYHIENWQLWWWLYDHLCSWYILRSWFLSEFVRLIILLENITTKSNIFMDVSLA